ncbi:SUMF1/EgtB/PvdO family nonheme iron enzyme [Haloferula chungangensis]|uniref:SUMF1/EgtB/PvdO family nonheme iron enzyme n=1 Tax=Haloferula chungangensis TaxID=1048331 RepID=A0ABW2LE07_9BACT
MEERIIGDYRLIEPIHTGSVTTTWLAEQTSVRREVTVIELTDFSQREAFLNDTRVKASVDHPLIGSVYEAISEDDHCLVAMEKLPGRTLAERIASGETLLPVEFSHLLRMLSEAMLHLAAKGIATEPLTPAAIHFDNQGVLRVGNIACASTPDPATAAEDIARLGQSLPPLIPNGRPGASRALTVLAWMRGEGIERAITWQEIHSYSEQIESQLVEVSHSPKTPSTGRVRGKKSPLPAILGVVGGLAVLAGAAAFLAKGKETTVKVPPPSLPEPVSIATGKYPSPDGATENLKAFRISACEVTIGEYLEFLEMLELLDAESRSIYDAEGQPNEKSGHQPKDWAEMLSAARKGGTWDGRSIDLFCPITNIDWWDAAAYCDWKGGRLPTQEEWFAALREKVEKPEFLQPASWGPVTSIGKDDQTDNGLFGMAGSVSEWTRRPAANPANPLGKKSFVIIGASFLKPADGALARDWTDDRQQQRPDLGFRIVLPAN